MSKRDEVEQIADMIGGHIEKHIAEDGTVHLSIETDDQGVSGDGSTDAEAYASLVRAADAGWRIEE